MNNQELERRCEYFERSYKMEKKHFDEKLKFLESEVERIYGYIRDFWDKPMETKQEPKKTSIQLIKELNEGLEKEEKSVRFNDLVNIIDEAKQIIYESEYFSNASMGSLTYTERRKEWLKAVSKVKEQL